MKVKIEYDRKRLADWALFFVSQVREYHQEIEDKQQVNERLKTIQSLLKEQTFKVRNAYATGESHTRSEIVDCKLVIKTILSENPLIIISYE